MSNICDTCYKCQKTIFHRKTKHLQDVLQILHKDAKDLDLLHPDGHRFKRQEQGEHTLRWFADNSK